MVSVAAAPPGGLSITNISPTQIDSGDTVTVTGSGFGGSQGSSVIRIGSVTQTATSWADGQIVFTANRSTDSMGAATFRLEKG